MVSKSGGCNSSNRDEININKINTTTTNNNNKKKLDNWREYFRKSNSDIFDIIEHAIIIAASDYPKEYNNKKSRIAELLFSCRRIRCFGCDRVELATTDDVVVGNGDDDVVVGGGNAGDDDDDDDDVDINFETGLVNDVLDPGSNFSFDEAEAEALTDLIEEEKMLINEVLRIKDILYNSQDESDSVLFESLRRLELMHLSISMLKETEIGKAVNRIRRHSSKEIRHLARSLIDGWKIIVDEWVKSSQDNTGGTPDSINPSTVDEEEGLPSPPMDDGVFFSTQTMDFNQFFDGMDDDGNPRNSGEFNENRKSGGKPSVVKPDTSKRREEPPKQVTPVSKDNRPQQMKMQPLLPKASKPSSTQSGPGRPLTTNGDVKFSKDSMIRPKLEKPAVQRRPAPQPDKLRPSNEDSVQDKLAATKRKLQERYQQAENAKRQRTIQVMDIHDLPKQGVVNKNPHAKFGNQNRHWANGRK